DVDIEAQIDAERSWSNAALLMVIPVKTRGSVDVEFTLKRADRVLLTRRYNETVETFAVPAAELAGRTWVAGSRALERAVGRLAGDIDARTARRLESGQPMARVAPQVPAP
ncbi:MAG TPA: hypothetical protein VLT59_16820, partial [Steroidobacteraceae bacterium]|nr:hypothetical protein [Steroidobacteraceae bacterium]